MKWFTGVLANAMAGGNVLREMLDHERWPAPVHAERVKAEGVWQLK